ANLMLNVRLSKIAASQSAPIGGASADSEDFFRLSEIHSITASCQPDQWKPALAAVEQELRRALQFGFSDSEFDDIKKELLAIAQAGADQADTRQPNALVERIIDTLASNGVFTHPKDDLAYLREFLSDMTRQETEAALRKAWDGRDVKIWLQGNLPLAGDTA